MSQSGHKRKNDIEQVASFIEEHYADPVTLGGMAKIFMTNPCALSRSFKRYMGVPPISYLNRVRIQAAKELIENSDLSLTQVCSRVGYESLTYFGRVFKEFTGVTPSQFRRQVRSRLATAGRHCKDPASGYGSDHRCRPKSPKLSAARLRSKTIRVRQS